MPFELTDQQLAGLFPFSTYNNPQILNDVRQRAKVQEYGEGTILFKRDQADEYVNWLLAGSLDLLDRNFDVVNLKAEDQLALSPVDDCTPHAVTAVTTSHSVVLRLRASYLDMLKKLTESGNYVVSSVEEADESDSDWMSAMLSSPLFDFLPPANIQALFTRFEEVEYKAGDVVIKQGESGDYFYVIKTGRTKVEYFAAGRVIPLAELGPGAFFGEDALISDVPRNATITMLTDGALMRLSEEDFETLLQAPVLEKLPMNKVEEMIAEADPLTWILDVRTKHEFQAGMIENSINMPILNLRRDLGKLDKECVYVVRSGGDKRAELATYILLEHGYNAFILSESRR